jgi:hypothetical protein
MLARLFSIVLLLAACLGLSVSTLAQTGHPAKGSWTGDITSSTADTARLRLLIDAFNGELSGTVNPGRRAVDMTAVTLDPDTWTLTIRAPMPEGELVLTGTLSNLGSWSNRKYIGTYRLGNESGAFELTLN